LLNEKCRSQSCGTTFCSKLGIISVRYEIVAVPLPRALPPGKIKAVALTNAANQEMEPEFSPGP